MRQLMRVVVPLCLTGLWGCGAAEYDADVYPSAVEQRPPEPRQEAVGEPPSEGMVWASGYWYWTGANYTWVTGRWATAPAPGHLWIRSGWTVYGDGYRYMPGYWAPAGYRPGYRYVYPIRRHRRY